ncbi:MuDR family transposase [Trifolium repens]|nr:MuDR family transposase [Trifolium repens]
MGNNEDGEPNPGCVHLRIHFEGGVSLPILNVDPDRYSYFDLVDDINGLATNAGYKDAGLSVALSFFHRCSESRNPIKTDSDVLEMFKLNNMCSCIHVYATLLNHEETKLPRQYVDTIISESDVEWVGDELEQNESEETNSSYSDINEERINEINIDELSDYEEKHDVIVTDQNSDEDKMPIYLDRGMKGRIFEPLSDGKFKTLLLSTQFWVVAMAYNEFLFDKAMDKLRKVSNEAANWLLDPERPKSMWANWLGDDRKKTILSMVESITCRLMARFQTRFEKGCGFENIITPKIRKVLDTTMQDGRICKLTYAGDDEFQVKDGFTTFVVNLRSRTCGCDYWRVSGLPCKHACACIAYKREM